MFMELEKEIPSGPIATGPTGMRPSTKDRQWEQSTLSFDLNFGLARGARSQHR